MRYALKVPFADLWFAGFTDDGDLIFATRDRAVTMPSREAFADYLPDGVIASFVLVPEEPTK